MATPMAYNYIANLDTVNWLAKINEFTREEWLDYDWRQKVFAAHRHTETIPLIYDERSIVFNETTTITRREKYNLFVQEVAELENTFKTFYGFGFIARLLIVKMLANSTIPPHVDGGTVGHRHHIPVITNTGVIFTVGGEEKHMKQGEIWEINNQLPHAVVNHGNKDRVHLIADWITKEK
jgi:hypothetical protein